VIGDLLRKVLPREAFVPVRLPSPSLVRDAGERLEESSFRVTVMCSTLGRGEFPRVPRLNVVFWREGDTPPHNARRACSPTERRPQS